MFSLRPGLLCVLVGLAACVAEPARADFRTALAAFDRGEFAPAADEFERLARIGHASAQYNLGLMLAEGQGRKRDLQGSFNWLTAAAMNGLMDGEPVLSQLRAIPRLDAAAAEEHAKRFRRLTGFELAALPAGRDVAGFVAPKQIGTLDVVFPDAARAKGMLGMVWVAFVIGTDGRVEDAWTLSELPDGLFGPFVEAAARRQRFSPAMADGQPVRVVTATRIKFAYVDGDPDLSRNALALRKMSDLRAQAEGGDAGAQTALAMLLAAYPELKSDAEEARRRLDAAVDARVTPARYFRGFRQLYSRDGTRDPQRAIDDLLEAGYAGDAASQMLVALNLLRVDDERATVSAINWLGAAAPGNPRAARFLAALLLTTPHSGLRDADRAAALLEPQLTDKQLSRDPLLWEIAAMLAAVRGDFPAAIQRQRRALSLVAVRENEATLAVARLGAYQAQQVPAGMLVPVPKFLATVVRGDGVRRCEDRRSVGQIPDCEPID